MMKTTQLRTLASVSLLALIAACSQPDPATEDRPDTDTAADAVADTPTPASREGLGAGLYDAESAAWNLELTASHPSPPGFFEPDALWSPPVRPAPTDDEDEAEADEGDDDTAAEDTPAEDAVEADVETPAPPSPISFANTDLAFTGDRVIMGNFHGFNVFDASTPDAPEHILSVVCPGGQGDVSVHGDLVFYSVEQNRGRLDCGAGGIDADSSAERFRGVRIFDISDLDAPRQVAAVQTCRGSHTHTLVPHPTDDGRIYVYVSGTSSVRPDSELAGCSDGEPEDNPETARYRIDVIEVALDAPETAAVINRPRIFADAESGAIAGLWRGGEPEEGQQRSSATAACHDITVYPEMNLAGGACGGNGILLDISDPANPVRISDAFDTNMAYWHSATFNNDATKILFTDEWGGGLGARCRPEDPENWGADIIVDITEDGLQTRGYFKIPGNQTAVENCVAHNGSLVPVPGRDLMVQGWYSGGISVVDFTDSNNPYEIAWFDRGPLDAEQLYLGGHWAAYWHNGRIYAPEIVRGLDVLRLMPSEHLSENEIAAAMLIRFDEANTQTQVRFDWPDEPVVAHAYLDQLARGESVTADLLAAARDSVTAWQSGTVDPAGLAGLAGELGAAADIAEDSADQARLTALSAMLARIE